MLARFPIVALPLLLGTIDVAGAGETVSRPRFVVSSFDLGTVPQVKATAAELVAELTADEWCTAEAKASAKWNEVPLGVDPKQWVSVVTVGYGNRADAYALMFDGPQGSARLIAHTPNPKGTLRGVPYWYSPFVKLLNGFRVGYAAPPPPPASSPPLFIQVREVAAPTKIAVGNKPTLDEARTIDPEKVLPPLKALLLATACEAGWAPAFVPEALGHIGSLSLVEVEVQVLDQACSFTFRFTHAGRSLKIVKERVSWEEFHDQLTALFRLPLDDKHIHDFVRLGAGRVELLAAHGDRIAYLVDDELAALDTATGREAWRIRIPQPVGARTKKIEQYAVRRDASDGRPRLYRTSGKPAEIAWADGKELLVPNLPAEPIATVGDLQFVFDPADETLTALEGKGRATKWRFAAGDRLFQPPQEFAGQVLVVTKQNRIVLLDPASGKVTAETTRPTWIVGVDVVKHHGVLNLAVTDLDGNAVLLGDGLQTVWQAKIPTRPTGRPAVVLMPAVFQKPAAAPGGDDLLTAIAADATKPQEFFVLTDADGFMYRLTLPGRK